MVLVKRSTGTSNTYICFFFLLPSKELLLPIYNSCQIPPPLLLLLLPPHYHITCNTHPSNQDPLKCSLKCSLLSHTFLCPGTSSADPKCNGDSCGIPVNSARHVSLVLSYRCRQACVWRPPLRQREAERPGPAPLHPEGHAVLERRGAVALPGPLQAGCLQGQSGPPPGDDGV